MRLRSVMRWVGPAAILTGLFMVLSDLSGMGLALPGSTAPTPLGFSVVGSGLVLLALTLLMVGMVGLYVRQTEPAGPRVVEYGDRDSRYVDPEFLAEELAQGGLPRDPEGKRDRAPSRARRGDERRRQARYRRNIRVEAARRAGAASQSRDRATPRAHRRDHEG
jgi:hypothetical protein